MRGLHCARCACSVYQLTVLDAYMTMKPALRALARTPFLVANSALLARAAMEEESAHNALKGAIRTAMARPCVTCAMILDLFATRAQAQRGLSLVFGRFRFRSIELLELFTQLPACALGFALAARTAILA